MDEVDEPLHQAEARFAALLRSTWMAVARATRSMGHLPMLPGQHVEALQQLAAAGGLTPAQLAVAMRLSRPTISELVRRMVEDDLVERVPSESDGRSVVLRPTESALQVLEAFQDGIVHVVSAGLQRLPSRESRRLLADVPALLHLHENLREIAAAVEQATGPGPSSGRER